MPYISTEHVAKIRKELKEAFPTWKISVRRDHHSTVVVTVLEATLNLIPATHTGTSFSPNEYHLHSSYQGQALVDVNRIREIATKGVTSYGDGDYGKIPDWYFDLRIGDYDRPFVYNSTAVANPAKKVIENAIPAKTGNLEMIDYSEKSIALFGESKHLKHHFALIGRPNFHLVHPETKLKTFGWIFPKTKKAEVAEIILANILSSINK